MVSEKSVSASSSRSSRLMASGHICSHMMPTEDCDILMTFSKATSEDILNWVISRIKSREPQLIFHIKYHHNTGIYGFYFTATYNSLLKSAEELSVRKNIKAEYGGGMKDFVYADKKCFAAIEDSDVFFSSQERQSIVLHMLYNIRAKDGDVLGKIKFLEGQSIIPLLVTKKVVNNVLPLHNRIDLTELRRLWVKSLIRHQPMDKIQAYFGVKIAIYFAYLGHYTKSLLFPTLIGVLLWTLSGNNQDMDNIFFVLFALINVLWATLYLESWKRTSAEYAYNWGVDVEDELIVESRPLFHGKIVRSKVTGRFEQHYPAWKRNVFRYFVSWPVILICLSIVFSVMLGIFAFQDWINEQVRKDNIPSMCRFFPKIILAVVIGIMDEIYKKIAYWLNDKENYRLEVTYENNLIVKLVLFQFVNSFLSLFYIAFYLQDMDRLKDQLATLLITRQVIGNIKEAVVPYVLEKAKLFKMGYKMTKYMNTGILEKQPTQIVTGIGLLDIDSNTDIEEVKEVNTVNQQSPETASNEETSRQPSEIFNREKVEFTYSTAVTKDSNLRKTSKTLSTNEDLTQECKGPILTQAEIEATMKQYEGTFEDHLEMFIQFGYVTLFSSAFPLAALCALLNNVIEIRSDAFKLCMSMQRPFGQRVAGIGTWQDALEIMSVIAVMVNCAMIGMSDFADRLFPNFTTSGRIIAIVILEHVILAMKFMLAYAIPDVPYWVAEEKARLEFLRRNALKKIESKNPVPTSKHQKADSTISYKSDIVAYVEDYKKHLDRSGKAPNCVFINNFISGKISLTSNSSMCDSSHGKKD